AQARPGVGRVGVVADAEADLSEVLEAVAAERDVAGGRDLYGGRYLHPAVAGRFELRASRGAGGDEVRRLGVLLSQEGAVLLVGVADRRTRGQPGGVCEPDVLDRQVGDRVAVAAGDLQERGQPGQLDVEVRGALSGGRLVVQQPGLRVEVPLSGALDERE